MAGLREVQRDGSVEHAPGEHEAVGRAVGGLGEQPGHACADGEQRLQVEALILHVSQSETFIHIYASQSETFISILKIQSHTFYN